MPTHSEDPLGSHGKKPEEIDASLGYEQSDVRVTGIVVFLTALMIFVAVCGILTYGMGKLINAQHESGRTVPTPSGRLRWTFANWGICRTARTCSTRWRS